jgi:hypothetical protein
MRVKVFSKKESYGRSPVTVGYFLSRCPRKSFPYKPGIKRAEGAEKLTSR